MCSALILSLLLTSPVVGQTASSPSWTPNLILQVKRFGTVVPSPDGRRVAFVVREAVMDDTRSEFVGQIFLANADGTNLVQLTRAAHHSDTPQWSPDGKHLVFLSNRTGRANLYQINVAGGESEQLTDVRTLVTSFQWSPDGKQIAFTCPDTLSAQEEAAVRMKADVKIMDENWKVNRLFTLGMDRDASGKRPIRLLTAQSFQVFTDAGSGYDWSPDGKSIVFSHVKTPSANDWPTADISIVDVATTQLRPLANTAAAESSPKYSPDGRSIAYVCSDVPVTWAGANTICVVPAKGGKPRPLAPTPDGRPSLLGWAPDGEHVYVSEVDRTRSVIYSVPMYGEPSTISTLSGTSSTVTISRDNVTAGYAWETSSTPPEAFVTRLDRFGPTRVSSMNSGLVKAPVGRTETVRWKSTDGMKVEGLLTYPTDYRAGQKYPLLVVVHGGPAGVFTEQYIGMLSPYPVAVFANKGYAVLRPNPRGSSGYGPEFRHANSKDWGGGDFQDIMTGVDSLVEAGLADPQRLGVMGWSYGGYMTSWIITHSSRFKAASVGAGVTNLVSFTGTTDIPSFVPSYFGGELWNAPTLYRERSAMFHIGKVTTPTLIQHGSNDDRVPLSQGVELYTALKRQGCTTKMVVYPRSGHSIGEPRLIIDAMQRNVAWFDQHVKGVDPLVAQGPPATRRDNVKETLHEVDLVDPYRWLEDQASTETRTWIATQQKYAQGLLSQLPGRAAISRRLGELMKIDTMGAPTVAGGRYFFSKRAADQDLPVFYVRQGKEGKDEVLLDCHLLSPDKTISATPLDTADDGSLWVYGLRVGGEDEVTVKIRDVASKADRPDVLPRGRYFGVQLSGDKSKLYFSRQTPAGPRVYVKPLTPKSGPEVEIFGEGYGPDKIISVQVTPEGKYLVVTVLYGSAASKTELRVFDLSQDRKLILEIADLPARFNGQIGGDTLFVSTNWEAPKNRILAIDLKNPDREKWKTIVAESKNVLQSFALIDGKVFATYLDNVYSQQVAFMPDGTGVGAVKFPGIGTGGAFGQWHRSEAFFSFNSFVTPTTIYHFDPVTRTPGEIWSRPKIPLQSEEFIVKQVRYPSKDGTEIPMFLVHRKDLKLDGNNPVFLTGYGGFNLSRTPGFSASIALWVEQGGVYALPSLRGGGEFGEAWHRAGMREKKQNVFDDFIAAAEFLIKTRYTKSEKLAIAGGSNGGLLVGAALTQRPELFQAVVCSVPLLDMIRYHKFLVARFWVPEYGSSEQKDQFKYLLAYSPYHRVKPGTKYPAVMFVTGDADTRVDPLHARKMCALLQASTASGPEKPVLLHYDTKAGHSAGKPVSKQIADLTDEFAFLFQQVGVTVR